MILIMWSSLCDYLFIYFNFSARFWIHSCTLKLINIFIILVLNSVSFILTIFSYCFFSFSFTFFFFLLISVPSRWQPILRRRNGGGKSAEDEDNTRGGKGPLHAPDWAADIHGGDTRLDTRLDPWLEPQDRGHGSTVLWSTVLWSTVLWSTVLWSTVLWSTVLWLSTHTMKADGPWTVDRGLWTVDRGFYHDLSMRGEKK